MLCPRNSCSLAMFVCPLTRSTHVCCHAAPSLLADEAHSADRGIHHGRLLLFRSAAGEEQQRAALQLGRGLPGCPVQNSQTADSHTAAARSAAIVPPESCRHSCMERPHLQAMAALNERPIIMPLSNPTSKSECTFQAAVAATEGRVLFASGSPFPPCQHGARSLHPAQANNAYIFPAVGHAAVLTRCREIRRVSMHAGSQAGGGRRAGRRAETGKSSRHRCFARRTCVQSKPRWPSLLTMCYLAVLPPPVSCLPLAQTCPLPSCHGAFPQRRGVPGSC